MFYHKRPAKAVSCTCNPSIPETEAEDLRGQDQPGVLASSKPVRASLSLKSVTIVSVGEDCILSSSCLGGCGS